VLIFNVPKKFVEQIVVHAIQKQEIVLPIAVIRVKIVKMEHALINVHYVPNVLMEIVFHVVPVTFV
jgi:hypothetical protein